MRKIAAWSLALLLAGYGLAAAQELRGPYKVFLQDENGKVMLAEAYLDEAGEAVLASGACNGGQCATSTGLTLSCPASGGPSCTSAQVCSCACVKNADETWSAVNKCRKPVASPEPLPH